ncbi:MAG TPA: M1 family peptidase, partial [Micromonosporaceae bacterium]|nr:M1 family peptidase [Micromonosporaceae bacterium]
MTRSRAAMAAAATVLCLAAGCTAGGRTTGEQTTATGSAGTAPLPTRAPTASPAGPPDGTSRPVADPVYPAYGNPRIDVRHYDLDLRWDPATRVLTGAATLTVRAVVDLDDIALDFTDALTVDAATVDGDAVR